MKHVVRYCYRRPAQPPPPESGGLSAAKFVFMLLLAGVSAYAIYKAGRALIASQDPGPVSVSRRNADYALKDAEWSNMTGALEAAARAYPGRVGIYIKDMNTGKTWTYNPDRLFPSASLIKVPIMAAVFGKIRSGELTLETPIKITRGVRRGGSGSLKWVREGTRLSAMEVIYKMITESDNTATQMLIDYVGLGYLQYAFEKMGLVYTNITAEGMSLSSGRVARENYTTAREMAALMERIYEGDLVDRESSGLMLDILKHTHSTSRLRRGLPLGWEIGHKTGLLRNSCHDVGIVFSPRGDYIIAVLTSEIPSYRSAKAFISKVAKLTYQYYKIDADYAQLRPASGSVRSL